MSGSHAPKSRAARRQRFANVDPVSLDDKQLRKLAKEYGVRKVSEGELQIVQQRLLQYDVQVLTVVLSRFPTFRRVTLRQCFLRDDVWLQLVQCLMYQQQLELLDIRHNMLTGESIASIMQLLRNLPTLRHLDLRDNVFGSDDVLRVFDECLMQMDSFNGIPVRLITSNAEQTVRLGNLRIQKQETAVIGKALRVNRSITHLSVAANDLDADGAANIISALIGHPNLASLDLSKNSMIQSRADLYVCALLEDLVSKSKKLSVINVEGSAVPAETLRRIEDSLKVNRILRRESEHFLEYGNRHVNLSERDIQAMLRRLDIRETIPEAKLDAEDERDMFCRFLDEHFKAQPMHVPPLINPDWQPPLEFDEAYAAETKMQRRRLVIEGNEYYFVADDQTTNT